MLISTNWIKDFVEIPPLSPLELGQRFTLATAEVEEVKSVGEHFKKIIVAQITHIEPHPQADKLNLVTFTYGDGSSKQVVCGAPNVEVGKKVPYAPLGTSFPNGLTLTPKKIRGILSDGMLCSSRELDLGDDHSGLMILNESAPLGESMSEYLGKNADVVLDVDNKSLTHRPDLWGHFGLAREFGAIFDKPLKNRFDEKWTQQLKAKLNDQPSPVIPVISGQSCAKAYMGLSIDGVEVTHSPLWMQERLDAAGMRPINNIVDISNYVMLELGLPNHIFDRDLIDSQKLTIHALEENYTLKTLDDVERELIPGDTVISDGKGPLVIAGIMGGSRCEVNEKTTNLFIEVANWIPAEVRKCSTRLGLRTEASQRFEKSLDTQLIERTMLRILELILEFCPKAKVCGKIEFSGPDTEKEVTPLKLKTSFQSICTKLGKDIPKQEILRIFKALDFKTTQENEDQLSVVVPTYRATKDVEMEADLVEEIGRIIGYDNIQPTAPIGPIAPTKFDTVKKLHRKIEDFMVLHGQSFQVLTYPLVGKKLLEKVKWPDLNDDLVLLNSLSKEQDRMRPSLIPSLLESAAKNQKNYDSFRLFELGRSYCPAEKNFSKESNQLGIVFYDKKNRPIVDLANVVEDLLRYLSIPGELVDKNDPSTKKHTNPFIPTEWQGTHPNEYLHIKIMGRFAGSISSVHPMMLRQFKMKGKLAVAVLDLSNFELKPPKQKFVFKPLSKFPVSTFDCTVLASTHIPVEQIINSLKKCKAKERVSSKIVDVFTLDDKTKAVTLRHVFTAEDTTLSADQLTKAQDQVIQSLKDAGYSLKV